jgi:hypothetical protein
LLRQPAPPILGCRDASGIGVDYPRPPCFACPSANAAECKEDPKSYFRPRYLAQPTRMAAIHNTHLGHITGRDRSMAVAIRCNVIYTEPFVANERKPMMPTRDKIGPDVE